MPAVAETVRRLGEWKKAGTRPAPTVIWVGGAAICLEVANSQRLQLLTVVGKVYNCLKTGCVC